MRMFLVLFLAVILVFISVQIFNVHKQAADFGQKNADASAQANALSTENQKYQDEIQYYQNQENLGKEALKYNLKKPGDQSYILVPPQASGTPSH